MLVVGIDLVIGIGCGISVVGEAPLDAGAVPTPTVEAGEAGEAGATSNDSSTADHVAPSECAAWKPRHFDPCNLPPPGGAIATPATGTLTYDTDLPGFTGAGAPANPPSKTIDQGGTPAVIISVDSLTIPEGGTLRVVGAKPLLVAAWSSIMIAGTLDVGSHQADARAGAGSSPALCSGSTGAPGHDEADTGGGSGGGGGGAFEGEGGGGGPGDTAKQNAGGVGGKSVKTPAIVRGGCNGAASGKAGLDAQVTAPSTSTTTSPGGAGGGAIELAAKSSIAIAAKGRVLAGGAGGSGAPLHSAVGGGGGGAGGYVGFDAPTYDVAAGAHVAANGGGGGGSNLFSTAGAAGTDGDASTTPAPGGPASSCSLQGGPGGAGATLNGVTAVQDEVSCGGGGGGGGVGFILVFGASFKVPAGAVFSPAPTIQ